MNKFIKVTQFQGKKLQTGVSQLDDAKLSLMNASIKHLEARVKALEPLPKAPVIKREYYVAYDDILCNNCKSILKHDATRHLKNGGKPALRCSNCDIGYTNDWVDVTKNSSHEFYVNLDHIICVTCGTIMSYNAETTLSKNRVVKLQCLNCETGLCTDWADTTIKTGDPTCRSNRRFYRIDQSIYCEKCNTLIADGISKKQKVTALKCEHCDYNSSYGWSQCSVPPHINRHEGMFRNVEMSEDSARHILNCRSTFSDDEIHKAFVKIYGEARAEYLAKRGK